MKQGILEKINNFWRKVGEGLKLASDIYAKKQGKFQRFMGWRRPNMELYMANTKEYTNGCSESYILNQ